MDTGRAGASIFPQELDLPPALASQPSDHADAGAIRPLLKSALPGFVTILIGSIRFEGGRVVDRANLEDRVISIIQAFNCPNSLAV